MQDEPTPHREQRQIRHPADQGTRHALVVPKAGGARLACHGGLEPAELCRHHSEEVHQIGEHKQGTELMDTEARPWEEAEENPRL